MVFHLVSLEDEGLTEQAIEVRWVIGGEETCRVGFLQRNYVPLFHRYINKIAQIREVWDSSDESVTKRKLVQHNVGCCIAGIMGPNRVAGVEDSFDNDNDARSSDEDSEKK